MDQSAATVRPSVQVVPEAVSFSAIPSAEDYEGQIYGESFGRVTLNEALAGVDADGNVVGYAVSVTSAEGYEGNVTLSVGLSESGEIRSIAFTELNETPGKGMLANEPEFKDQFSGKSADALTLTQSGSAAADDEIDAVSGATVTSKAVVSAVNAALDFYATVIRGE